MIGNSEWAPLGLRCETAVLGTMRPLCPPPTAHLLQPGAQV